MAVARGTVSITLLPLIIDCLLPRGNLAFSCTRVRFTRLLVSWRLRVARFTSLAASYSTFDNNASPSCAVENRLLEPEVGSMKEQRRRCTVNFNDTEPLLDFLGGSASNRYILCPPSVARPPKGIISLMLRPMHNSTVFKVWRLHQVYVRSIEQ